MYLGTWNLWKLCWELGKCDEIWRLLSSLFFSSLLFSSLLFSSRLVSSRPVPSRLFCSVLFTLIWRARLGQHCANCAMGLFWRRNRFVVWLLRGCAENWVKRRPPKQSNNTVRINLGPVARANRLFARWRHFTTTTRILQGFALLCKLSLLLFKPRLDYQILIWKKSEKDSGLSSKVTVSCK